MRPVMMIQEMPMLQPLHYQQWQPVPADGYTEKKSVEIDIANEDAQTIGVKHLQLIAKKDVVPTQIKALLDKK
jgi:hypothetical protein